MATATGSWPRSSDVDYGVTPANVTNGRFLALATNDNLRGTVATAGTIDITFYANSTSSAIVFTGRPEFVFVYAVEDNGQFFFVYNGGGRGTADKTSLSISEVEALYTAGSLFSVSPPAFTEIRGSRVEQDGQLVIPDGVDYVYPVGIGVQNISHVSGDTEGERLFFGILSTSIDSLPPDPDPDPDPRCPIPEGLCLVEINAAEFIRQKRLTFYPLEIL